MAPAVMSHPAENAALRSRQIHGLRGHLAMAFLVLAPIALIGTGGATAATAAVATLPAPTEPVASLLRGLRMTSRLPVRVYWGAWPYPETPIVGYRVQLSEDGGPWTRTKKRDAADMGVHYALSFGKDYLFRLRAIDATGNRSPWAVSSLTTRLRRFDDRSPAVIRSGEWHKRTDASAYRHTLLGSGQAGDSLTFSFTGRAVGIVAPATHRQRNVDVYVDGVYAATLRVHAINPTRSRKVVFTQGGFGDGGTHEIEIRVPGGGRPDFRLDAFVVLK